MLKRLLRKWLGIETEPVKPAPEKPAMRITSSTLARTLKPEPVVAFDQYKPPVGVIPADKVSAVLAMDATPYDYINNSYVSNYWQGYPALSMLSQLPEYRKPVSELAKGMVRKWVRLTVKGDDGGDDKADKIAKLIDAMERFKIKELFKEAAEHDGFFGRGQIFIDVKKPDGSLAQDDPEELETPLIMHKAKIKKDSLAGFRLVEPVWTYPSAYNSTNPLAADYYKPSKWYVMGRTVHHTRMLMFISRPMPDLLKSAYNFGGLAMTQIAQPYVQNWIRTRDSVSDLVHSFSVTGLKTDLSGALGGADDATMVNRAALFTQARDNRGLMMVDKDSEEFFNMVTPLGGLDSLQQQSQEQMASVFNTPLIVLLGITPSGLNASSEGEIKVWNEYIAGQQEAIFTPNLNIVLDILQLNEFGDIDQDITYEWEALEAMNDTEKATINKTNADTDAVLIQSGVIMPEEARERLVADVDSGYTTIDASKVPEQQDEGGDDDQEGDQAQDIALDMTWRESEHDRADNGQFGSGGGGKTKTAGEVKAQKDREARQKFGYVDSHGNNRSGGLSRSEHISEGAFHISLEHNRKENWEKYFKENGKVVDPDKIKKMSNEFAANPDLAHVVHEPSSQESKRMFTHLLEQKAKEGDTSPVLFTAGGSGSGKSTTLPIAQKIMNAKPDGLIFDSVLGSRNSAMKKIDEALEATKATGDVVGIAYTNAPIDKAFAQNIGRERSVKISTLVSAHAGASKTIKELADEYRNNKRVKIVVTNNAGTKEQASVGTLDDVPTYDAPAEIERLKGVAKELLDSGDIDQKKYDLLVS